MLPAIALVACATYKTTPLPTAVDWAQDLAALDVTPSLPLPEGLGVHAFDPCAAPSGMTMSVGIVTEAAIFSFSEYQSLSNDPPSDPRDNLVRPARTACARSR